MVVTRVTAKVAVAALVVGFLAGYAVGGDARVSPRPLLGWRSWNYFGVNVTHDVIETVIVSLRLRRSHQDGAVSLQELGYSDVGIDDGWQLCGSGYNGSFHDFPSGSAIVDKTKFPDLGALVRYGHNHNMSMGFYLLHCYCHDAGVLRQNRTWELAAYTADAALVVDSGFDSVKLDSCNDDFGVGYETSVNYFRLHGRYLLVEDAAQGKNHTYRGPPANATDEACSGYHMFRASTDIFARFDVIMRELQSIVRYLGGASSRPISRPGCWAYMDMLEVGNPGLTYNEARTHFGAWCVVSSPLVLGLDLTNETAVKSVWDIISNKKAIAVNQAWAGSPGRLLVSSAAKWQVWSKLIDARTSEHAILVLNMADKEANNIEINIGDLLFHGAGACLGGMIWGQYSYGLPHQHATSAQVLRIDRLEAHDSVFATWRPTKDVLWAEFMT